MGPTSGAVVANNVRYSGARTCIVDKRAPSTMGPRLRDNMVPKAFQAGYANTTGFRKVVKATIYIKKKHGMSDDDFVEYYNNNHAQRAVPILQRHGILSYSLV
jgi:hypothetical protein